MHFRRKFVQGIFLLIFTTKFRMQKGNIGSVASLNFGWKGLEPLLSQKRQIKWCLWDAVDSVWDISGVLCPSHAQETMVQLSIYRAIQVPFKEHWWLEFTWFVVVFHRSFCRHLGTFRGADLSSKRIHRGLSKRITYAVWTAGFLISLSCAKLASASGICNLRKVSHSVRSNIYIYI